VRSCSTFAGSCTASRGRHDANAADKVLTELDPGDGLGQQDRAGGDTTWVPAVSRSGAG
jgi:hypothetical protein